MTTITPKQAAEAAAITEHARFWIGHSATGRMIFDRKPDPADYPGMAIAEYRCTEVGAAPSAAAPSPVAASDEPIYQVWMHGVGGWRDATKAAYESARPEDRQLCRAPAAAPAKLDLEQKEITAAFDAHHELYEFPSEALRGGALNQWTWGWWAGARAERAKLAVAAAPAPVAAITPDLIAAGALRQLRHNDGSEGFVFAYDKAITDRELARHRVAVASFKDEAELLEFLDGLHSTVGDSETITNEKWPVAQRILTAYRAALAAVPAAAPVVQPEPEPDMLWWAEDGEVFAHSADEFAKDYAYNNMAPGETVDVRVDCAFRAKPERRTLRIGYVAGEEENRDRVECAWVDAAIASSADEVKP